MARHLQCHQRGTRRLRRRRCCWRSQATAGPGGDGDFRFDRPAVCWRPRCWQATLQRAIARSRRKPSRLGTGDADADALTDSGERVRSIEAGWLRDFCAGGMRSRPDVATDNVDDRARLRLRRVEGHLQLPVGEPSLAGPRSSAVRRSGSRVDADTRPFARGTLPYRTRPPSPSRSRPPARSRQSDRPPVRRVRARPRQSGRRLERRRNRRAQGSPASSRSWLTYWGSSS